MGKFLQFMFSFALSFHEVMTSTQEANLKPLLFVSNHGDDSFYMY
jgi:hypothetical protein